MNRETIKYLANRANVRPVDGSFCRSRIYQHAIVIPAMAEASLLPNTIASLAENNKTSLEKVLIVVVVNNRSADKMPGVSGLSGIVQDNQRTLQWLRSQSHSLSLQLGWIDASSPGHELPASGGVGMARKIGCDSALALLFESQNKDISGFQPESSVIFNLDADTLVQQNYLDAAQELIKSRTDGGTIQFEHQPAASTTAQNAIDLYELFLHYYLEGLIWAKSPYAFHTVGSTMLCTAQGYTRAGGMPGKRQAGEDFYFLQQLAKTGGVTNITCTTVHPSARISHRVPFGTGLRMAQALEQGVDTNETYDPRSFVALRELLYTIKHNLNTPPQEILARLTCPQTVQFLKNKSFIKIFLGFQKQFCTAEKRLAAFTQWFDALATFRLVNHLSTSVWPKMNVLDAWRTLLQLEGMPHRWKNERELLEWQRSRSLAFHH